MYMTIIEAAKKYCSGKRKREAGRYGWLHQSNTKVKCSPNEVFSKILIAG